MFPCSLWNWPHGCTVIRKKLIVLNDYVRVIKCPRELLLCFVHELRDILLRRSDIILILLCTVWLSYAGENRLAHITACHQAGTHYSLSPGWHTLQLVARLQHITACRQAGTHYSLSPGWHSLQLVTRLAHITACRQAGTHYSLSPGWRALQLVARLAHITACRQAGAHYSLSPGWRTLQLVARLAHITACHLTAKLNT
jgi:hypothetical protein